MWDGMEFTGASQCIIKENHIKNNGIDHTETETIIKDNYLNMAGSDVFGSFGSKTEVYSNQGDMTRVRQGTSRIYLSTSTNFEGDTTVKLPFNAESKDAFKIVDLS